MFLLLNPLLLVAETRIACVRKRPQSVTGRGLAMKMHRSGGGACCVSATNPLLVAETRCSRPSTKRPQPPLVEDYSRD